MLQHPASNTILTVINALFDVRSKANAEGAFDMSACGVAAYYQCGREDLAPCHCVAGWLTVAYLGEGYLANADTTASYGRGASWVNKILGFDWIYQDVYLTLEERKQLTVEGPLVPYLDKNPHLWGNPWGAGVFSSPEAYDGLYDGCVRPMDLVISQWIRFYRNVLKMEKSYLRGPYITVVPN